MLAKYYPRAGCCLLSLLSVFCVAPAGAQLRIAAPEPLDALLSQHLRPPGKEANGAALEAFTRDARQDAEGLLATEGYFSPRVEASAAPGRLELQVVPGPRTRVATTDIVIGGPLPSERRAALLDAWPLKPGQPFRDELWRDAKLDLLRALLAEDFPAAALVDSRADIDPENASAALRLRYDSGPRYVFGALQVSGLVRYTPDLVERHSRIEPGAPYSQKALLDLQAALQRTPYFSSASVGIARPGELPGGDSAAPIRAPVEVHVQETPPHRLSFGVGANTNTGAHGEVLYQGLIFLHQPLQLDVGMRLEQRQQRLFADIRLPPQDRHNDSFGVLSEREHTEDLLRRRAALAAVRTQVRGAVEARYALNWQREIQEPRGAPTRVSRALSVDAAWTLRRVDDPVQPRRGYVAQLKVGGGSKALLSDQDFLRLYSRYQHYFPIGSRDTLSLRGEVGATLAPDRFGIPDEFLFRTGGAQTVRGYRYQSLGVREGEAVTSGRFLATAGAEYTHWFTPRWGAALFVDAGDAADRWQALRMALGYGLGARWKSPAGPLAVDVAYGEREAKWRLHFSLAVAF